MMATLQHPKSRSRAAQSISFKSFRILRRLGRGGMGEVYLAEHRRLHRRCALKVIRADKCDDPQAIKRFRAEVEAMKSLKHSRIVKFLGQGKTADGRDFYAMEFLHGTNLDETVQRCGPLSPRLVVGLLRQLCSALSYVHENGFVHGDIKPANIMTSVSRRDFSAVKLVDFGLVAPMTTESPELSDTLSGGFVGSPLYAPPESNYGQRDARSDIYSLGATAYHLLIGRPVFDVGDPIRAVFAHAVQNPVATLELRRDVSPALNEIIMKCLRKNPDERFQSAQQLAEALEAVA
jgi:eukaryotic-like serine/threonine-protein kinase